MNLEICRFLGNFLFAIFASSSQLFLVEQKIYITKLPQKRKENTKTRTIFLQFTKTKKLIR